MAAAGGGLSLRGRSFLGIAGSDLRTPEPKEALGSPSAGLRGTLRGMFRGDRPFICCLSKQSPEDELEMPFKLSDTSRSRTIPSPLRATSFPFHLSARQRGSVSRDVVTRHGCSSRVNPRSPEGGGWRRAGGKQGCGKQPAGWTPRVREGAWVLVP